MILRANDIIKYYGKKAVVDGVSVQVKQGEIVGLLGPNGAGKTTSFYMMVGLVKPNEGNVFLDDVNITKLPMYKRAQMGVGYLAQEASVFRTIYAFAISPLISSGNLPTAARATAGCAAKTRSISAG